MSISLDIQRVVGTVEASARSGSQFDAQIAVIALKNGTRLATRNVCDFENCGDDLTNPWE